MTTYMHLRKTEAQDRPAENLRWEGTRPMTKGGITLAYTLLENRALLGAAFCCPRDSYAKSIGRSIAQGRLESQPLRLHVEGRIERRQLPTLLLALLIYQTLPSWSVLEEHVHLPEGQWSHRWAVDFPGPNGVLVRAEMDSRRKNLGRNLHTHPAARDWHTSIVRFTGPPGTWLARAPGWAPGYLERAL